MPLSSLVNTIKTNGGVECTWCMKNRDCQRIIFWSITAGSKVPLTVGRSTARMRPTVFTQKTLDHGSVEMLISDHTCCCKNTQKMQRYAYNALHWGLPSRKVLGPYIHTKKLSSRHLALRLTVFEIFTVKQPKRRPAAGGVIGPAYWAPASFIRPTPKKTPIA